MTAWTAPRTWTVGEVVTKAIMDTHVRDNLLNLKETTKTKEFWVPVVFQYYSASLQPITTYNGFPIAQLAAANDFTEISFRCPSDFTSITVAQIIVIPAMTNAAANWDISSVYAAVGEAYNTHTGSDAATTYNVTNNQIYGVDVSGILASMAANDYVGLKFLLSDSAHDVYVIGFYMTYA